MIYSLSFFSDIVQDLFSIPVSFMHNGARDAISRSVGSQLMRGRGSILCEMVQVAICV